VQSDGKIVVGGQIARRLLWYASMRTVPSTRLSGLRDSDHQLSRR
jgi:hypothetical protein